jgi:hypothetical protein
MKARSVSQRNGLCTEFYPLKIGKLRKRYNFVEQKKAIKWVK